MVASAPQLTKLNFEAVNSFCDSLDSYVRDEQEVSWVGFIPRHLQMTLSQKFVAQDLVTDAKPEAWKEWSMEGFSQKLRLQYPDLKVRSTATNPLEVQLAEVKGGHLTVYNSEKVSEYLNNINKVFVNCANVDTDESIAVNVLLKNLLAPYRSSSNRTVKPTKTAVNLNRLLQGANKPKTIMSYCIAIQRETDRGIAAINEARLWVDMPIAKAYDASPDPESESEYEMPSKKSKVDQGRPSDKSSRNTFKDTSTKAPFWCWGCGHKNFTRDKCPLCVGHPDRNSANVEWRNSKVYLKYSSEKGRSFILPLHNRADGTAFTKEEKRKMDELKKPLLANAKAKAVKAAADAKEEGEASEIEGNAYNFLSATQDIFGCYTCDVLPPTLIATVPTVHLSVVTTPIVLPVGTNLDSQCSCSTRVASDNQCCVSCTNTTVISAANTLHNTHTNTSITHGIDDEVLCTQCTHNTPNNPAQNVVAHNNTVGTKRTIENITSATHDNICVDLLNSKDKTTYLHPFYISTNNTNCLLVNVLIDTGAIQNNFVNRRVAAWMDKQHKLAAPTCTTISKGKSKVNLGGTNLTSTIYGNVSFSMKYFNEISRVYDEMHCLEFKIIDSTFDIIIGRPTIRKYKLSQSIPSYFEASDEGAPKSEYDSRPTSSAEVFSPCGCAHLNSLSGSEDTPVSRFLGLYAQSTEYRNQGDSKLLLARPRSLNKGGANARATQQLCIIANIVDKETLLDYESDTDYIDWPDNPYEISDKPVPSSSEWSLVDKIQLSGSVLLQKQIYECCKDFIDIFSETVRSDPADIPPMELKVDLEKWHSNKHRGPPRPQTKSKQREIEKQIAGLIKLKVVEPSTAAYYSQVHLVPKPTPDEWRFCLDYVKFNDCTEGIEGWPIPNIAHMLNRIGEKKPKIFGVMDMTSGYHQAPLSKSSQILSAFICFLGIFMWLRVPMGLKNAASYFQRVMATVVLAGILYIMCELYIDDVLVFGKDEESFVSNLRQVFTRLRKHRVTLNPKKCRLGMSQIEYVGHVISAEGVTFSKEKREKVLDFPLPKRMKELSGFLGLINYFRAHVSDMTERVKLLRQMVLKYDKNKSLIWTPEAEQAFYDVREEVASCPALFFVDENAPIIVMTDASDYGIGAYIYQLIDNVEKPIVFMSKALHGAELNWSTVEKEAYAIYATLTKYHHLLRDNKFLLRTDHKNLTYINLEGSKKVKNWKLALQEFDFNIEHVPGIDNPIADAFSRLCVLWEDDMTGADQICAINFEPETRIPEVYYRILSSLHNSVIGHFGVEKTITLLRKAGHSWIGMRKHIRQFIRQCATCQKLSDKKLALKIHPFTTASYNPMEVLNIDAIGPLEIDGFGNCHILVIICCFTRWVELVPIPNTDALSAARGILQHVGRFGVPSTIRSDRGPQFVNGLLAELSKLLHTEQDFTTAYSKEENAIVERANKEVMRHLRAIIFDDRVQSKWSMDQLPMVMRILNSEEKTSTGVSPAELLFGNTVNLGRELMRRPLPESSQTVADGTPIPAQPLSEYMENMLQCQKRLIEVAQATQLEKDSHHMSGFDPAFTEYPVNSYVLLDHPEGNRPKLSTKLKGPYQVINLIGSRYTIQNLLTGKNFDTHITNLRPFNYDSSRTDPKEVAMHDQHEFVLHEVIAHRGDRYRRSAMEFLVRWEGFGPEFDSWEPYSNLRDTEKLITYLSANRLKALIPQKHK
jgi:hypothetical protein